MLVQLRRLHFPGAAVVLLVFKRPILTVVIFQDLSLVNLVLVMLALLSLTLALHLTLAPFWLPLVLHKLVPPLTLPVPLVVLPIKLWLATNRLGMWLAAHQVTLMFAVNASWTEYLLCPNIMPWADNKVCDYIILGTTLPLGKTLPQSSWL